MHDEKLLQSIINKSPLEYSLFRSKFYTMMNTKSFDELTINDEYFGFMSLSINQWGCDVINDKFINVEIDEKLIDLIKNTKMNFEYVPCFFNSMFINSNIYFEDILLKGIFILDLYNHQDKVIQEINEQHEHNLWFCCFYYDLINDKEDRIFFKLSDIINDSNNLQNFIANFVISTMNLVESKFDDIEKIKIQYPKEQNEKRKKRNKPPLNDKMILRPNIKLIEYINLFNKRRINLDSNYKYLVMGHWMNFKDERYVNKKGQRTWVLPYWKGDGVEEQRGYTIKSTLR